MPPQTDLYYHEELTHGVLPELLHKLYRHRVPATVEVRRGETVKELYLREGKVIYAASSDRADSLGAFLVRQDLLDADELCELAKDKELERKRLGVVMLERGLLSPAKLHRAIINQVEEIAWSLFSWQKGDVRVTLGEHDISNAIEIGIPMRTMILRGIRRTGDPKPLIARVGGRDSVLQLSVGWEDLVDIGVEDEEFQLLQQVNAERTLYELCYNGPFSTADNAKVLYAFWVLELVKEKDGTKHSHLLRIRLPQKSPS